MLVHRILVAAAGLLAACHFVPQATAQVINMRRHERIVIVGGGPAGVHYATLLVKKGFTNITILEQSTEVGGKSKTVVDPLGIPHELGTCYATSLYQPVFDLLKEYDPTNTLVPFVPFIKGHTYVNRDAMPIMDYKAYVAQLVHRLMGPVKERELVREIERAFVSYSSIHTSIFGVYAYGLPPQPSDWSRIDMSGLEFLRQNKLLALEGFFRFVFQQQGYGTLDTAPAFYMLWWIHPDLLRKRKEADAKRQPWAFMLSKGYQSLWKAMVAKYQRQIDVQLDTKVVQIARTLSPIYVTVRRSNVLDIVRADHLVMATDLSHMVTLPSDLLANDISLTKDLTSSSFVVSLFESDARKDESVSQWWPNRGVGELEGRLQLTRNSRLSLYNPLPAHGSQSDPAPTNWGVNATGRQTRVAYQFYNQRYPYSPTAVKTQLLADLESASFTNAVVQKQIIHNYFPRYNLTQLQQGLPWKIWDSQGSIRTTWIGSSVSFESVLDVVVYNNKLIDRVNIT
ncbi:hypothetical protein DYB28_012141 [Aphanomyces astaci]|uniref:Amine oxidase domain-containing protein n=2 Tax=Aphanomyces astaci TaxID=112090 RepID=A0A397B7M0_APHAT|nr:hypothetical protein AaE_001670 [Aphanomyces astaci]RHY14682.1 hypothetical protein DYB36_009315 [Aphanomyces astaci]RLO07924.1 hypothetical protein DYB28_012141 [Aphanomyces astaci]